VNITPATLHLPSSTLGLVFHCEIPGVWHFLKLAFSDVKPYGFLKGKHIVGAYSDVSIDFAFGIVAKVDMIRSWDVPLGNFLKNFHLEKNNPMM
jgi:hypothetical protein